MDGQHAHSSPSSHSIRQNIHFSSPSNTKLAASLSSSSTPSSHAMNGEEPIVSTHISIESVLEAHANAPDPTRAALDAILAERNGLSAQNSQLWNHLKRQRANYASAVKDVVRLRSERDALKAKLSGSEGADGPPQPIPARKLRQSVSSAAMSSPSNGAPVPTREGTPPFLPGMSSSSSNPRARMTRHQSDDPPQTSQFDSPPPERRPQTPTLPYARSQDPIRGQDRERSNTHPGVTSVDPASAATGPTTPLTPDFQSTNHSKHSRSASIDVLLNSQPPPIAPTPLIIPPRDELLASSSASTTSGLSPAVSLTRPLNLSPRRDRPPHDVERQSSGNSLQLPSANNSSTSSSPIAMSPEEMQANEPRTAAHHILSQSLLAPVDPKRQASRESRISLPDEAKRFIANMGESPLNSPQTNNSPNNWNTPTNGRAMKPIAEDTPNGRATSRPFLDMDEDSDIDPRASEDTKVQRSDSEVDADGTEETAVDFDYTPKRGALSGNQQTPKMRSTAGTTADQFPLPPSTYNSPVRAPSPSSLSLVNEQTAIHATRPTRTSSTSSTVTESTLSTERRSRDRKHDSFMIPENLPAATFRQMPLVATDVKSASIKVNGSHIRANDKGREVLSFVIQVDVPGKDGWTIEKFYSDVLALDGRLRALCSRSTLKKLAPLPDSKLFKDHAPAKVDQRKQILQVYLQSVMILPIKDKNEIIVFFSTDIMRERSPVTKSGYKEGYLTKRGKNFGGWKTRYFVLQGPVLEYFENRGGAHLGSIPIVGAQIGRQQRTGDKRDSDDENEFRHAFLILERRRGPGGQATQHVLCAESDAERDAWVDVLMRYVMGSYNEDDKFTNGPTMNGLGQSNGSGQPRTSTSSLSVNEITSTGSRRSVLTKDLIQKSSATPVPISQLAQDRINAKFFQAAPLPDEAPSSSPARNNMSPSPVDRQQGSIYSFSDTASRSTTDKPQGGSVDEGQLSSSVPTSSNLDVNVGLASVGQRAASELGHYADMPVHRGSQASPEQSRPRERVRASYHPSLSTVQPSPTDARPVSPEPPTASSMKIEIPRQVKISGPVKAMPILDGQAFGGRSSSEMPRPANDRERKAKSRTFWSFGRTAEKQPVPTMQLRCVFGVSLDESLAVSQMHNLPAIIYRCIQFLEAKHAEQEEGIYRLSGSSAVIKGLKDRFNAEGDIDLLADEEDWDPHAIAGLLKSFLRELPASILTHDLVRRFLGVLDFVDVEERIKELQELVSKLPFPNYCLLRALIAHLILIVSNSATNKMTMRNIGIVFSPTLGVPAGVFSLMLGEFNRVFNVEGEGSDSPDEDIDMTEQELKRQSGGLSRRNSKRYSDAAVDQVLGLSGRTLSTTEEDRSDDGEDLSDGESNTEDTTEAETENQTVESSADSTRPTSPAVSSVSLLSPPSAPSLDVVSNSKSRASHVAASRGLNINVAEGEPRRMRMPGLPASPRPSPLNTPTSNPNATPSPKHTPR